MGGISKHQDLGKPGVQEPQVLQGMKLRTGDDPADLGEGGWFMLGRLPQLCMPCVIRDLGGESYSSVQGTLRAKGTPPLSGCSTLYSLPPSNPRHLPALLSSS